jgi:cyclopropane-fatty-acyl-phospholipid synthase
VQTATRPGKLAAFATGAARSLAAPAAARLPAFGPARLLDRLVASLRAGALTVHLPDGRVLRRQGAEAGPEASVTLHRWRPLLRLALRGDIGLAESYRDGDWSTHDLAALLELGTRNAAAWDGDTFAAWPLRLLLRLGHGWRANTRRGSRRNIAFHYDLGNDFYRLWLDADLVYSSGLYREGTSSLEDAQAQKLARIVELLELPGVPSARVLEIGCGWGALACTLARHGAAHVTGITLSAEQLAHARARARREGLEERVDLRLEDYRDGAGRFERIVSIEMIEAVGERYWSTYFDTLRERLQPGGIAVIQAITIADGYFERYRRHPDFIQRFIFPGGMLPSPGALQREASRAGLDVEVCETFGASYAATLAEWRRRFRSAGPAVAALGFDERFRRLWEYYLCYCEAGFRCGRVDVGLYRLTRRADADQSIRAATSNPSRGPRG